MIKYRVSQMLENGIFWCSIALILQCSIWSYADDNQWELVINKDGIEVYERAKKGSSIKEVKSVSVLEAPFDVVVNLFEDGNLYQEWCHKCKRLEVMEHINPFEKIVYYEVEMPWPFANRDSLSHHQKVIDPQTKAISYIITDRSKGIPLEDGIIRVTDYEGLWRLTPLEGGSVEIYFQQYTDVGGHAPKWLVNLFVTDIPFHSQRNFRALINKSLSNTDFR